MKKDRWNRIESILDTALTLSGEERDRYIDQVCGNDNGLLEEVYEILNAVTESEQTHFLENPFSEHSNMLREVTESGKPEDAVRELIGSTVGPFELTECVGRGGMGYVFKAQRVEGGFSQEAAVKLLNKGIRSRKTVERFRMEKEILSGLRHPNIAQLYDGGVSEGDIPYLVMEYVDGQPIDLYCEKNKLSVDDRLSLFADVCRAVQYAHSNLVVHRDLKAQNIYVTKDGDVKILDFGIAKLLNPKLSQKELLETGEGQKLWTPQYAAPEQVRGMPVTTATDVYALGVLLHKLLTDTFPLDLKDKNIAEVMQVISEAEPRSIAASLRKTTNAAEVARNRSTTSAKLAKKLSGDLDALVHKCLRKETEYRYESVSLLLDELQRYREGMPLMARKGTIRYRTGKFMRRHKTGLAVTASFIFLLIVFTSFYTVRITEERNRARQEAERATQITGFLKSVFQSSDPSTARGEEITAREMLENGIKNVNNLEQPLLKADMLKTLGEIYHSLSLYEKADSLLTASMALRTSSVPSQDADQASIMYELALTKESKGEYDTALVLLQDAIGIQKESLGDHHPETAKSIVSLAYLYKLKGELTEAGESIDAGISKLLAAEELDSAEYAEALYIKASILTENGKYDQAVEVQKESLEWARKLYEPPHAKITKNLGNLARNYQRLAKYDLAETYYLKDLEMTRQLYEGDHLGKAVLMNNISGVYHKQGKYDRADSLYRATREMISRILGDDHPYVAAVLFSWSSLKIDMEEYAHAEDLLRQTLEIDLEQLGDNHPNVAGDYKSLALVLIEKGDYGEAYELLQKALQIQQKAYDSSHPQLAITKETLAYYYKMTNQPRKREQTLKEALEINENALGYDHPNTKSVAISLAEVWERRGAHQAADSLLQLVED